MPKLLSPTTATLCACLLASFGAGSAMPAPTPVDAAKQAKPPPPATCVRGAPAPRQERALRREIAHLRAARGKARLRATAVLTRAARRHSHRLVRRGLFEHSARLPYGHSRAGGQNLARAWSARQAAGLMMHSPPHRRTLLDGRWRFIGVGAALDCHGMVTFTVNVAAEPPR
ncbi:MAG: hypothetical protein QOD86_2607 [Miltoncostaeaceae bacterium]|jgi:uncharacterized protein YkwD|nr:hypothetical protein [Miltoncostaeaceae bacterium]